MSLPSLTCVSSLLVPAEFKIHPHPASQHHGGLVSRRVRLPQAPAAGGPVSSSACVASPFSQESRRRHCLWKSFAALIARCIPIPCHHSEYAIVIICLLVSPPRALSPSKYLQQLASRLRGQVTEAKLDLGRAGLFPEAAICLVGQEG